jgi:hypothetical protein
LIVATLADDRAHRRAAKLVCALRGPYHEGREVPMKEAPALEPDPVIEAYKKDVDETLLIEALRLTPEQRLRKLMDLQVEAEELRRAGRDVAHPK